MYKVQQTIDIKLRNELDNQGYLCPLCKTNYTPLDAANLYDPSRNLLACSICSTEVTNNENEEQVKGNKDRMQKLNRQTKGIVDLLKRLEKVELPRFDIERYLAIHGPALGVTAQAQALASGNSQTNLLQPNVKVQIAGDDDELLEKQKRELELKEKRAQNMLPSWISKSTIEKNGTTTTTTGNDQGISRDDAVEDGEGEQGIVPPQLPREEQDQDDKKLDVAADTNGGLGSVDIGGFGAAMSFYEAPQEEEDEDGKPDSGDGGDDLDAYYASLEAQNLANQTPVIEGSSSFNSPITEGFDGIDSPKSFNASGTTGGTPDLGSIGGEQMEVISSGQGKRSRQESTEYNDAIDNNNKKFKSGEEVSPPLIDTSPVDSVEGVDEEEDEGEFDQVEGGEEENMDPDQLISVNGKMMPYSQVTEDMTSDMVSRRSAYVRLKTHKELNEPCRLGTRSSHRLPTSTA